MVAIRMSPIQTRPDPESPGAPAEIMTYVPLALALAGGLIEVTILYFQKLARPHTPLSLDFAWMTPLALVVIVLVVSTALGVATLPWRPAIRLGAVAFAAGSIVALNLLMMVPRLAHYAAAVLAAGIGVQIARATLARPAATARAARRASPWLLGLLIVTATLAWWSLRPSATRAVQLAAAPPASPNLLFITLDTARAANLSLHGYARATTPRIDRFARRGVVFDQAHATAPWTLPSHASMFTGRWPHELSATLDSPLDAKFPVLAEYLAARGYRTAGFVANLMFCGWSTGLNRGFDRYEDYPRSAGQVASSSTLARNVVNNFRLRKLIEDDEHINRVSAEEINRRALAWLEDRQAAPFFMFLNYFDAHEPYLPPPPFDTKFGAGRTRGRFSPLHHWLWDPAMRHGQLSDADRQEEVAAYDGGLAWLDHHIGNLLDELDRRDLLSNTVVVITSDHGEEFAEHGVYEHGYSLYRPSLHVPLVVVAPGRVPADRRVATPVSIRDLAVTILGTLGIESGASFPGASLATLWRDGAANLTSAAGLSPVFSEVSPSPGQPDWFPSSKGEMKAIVHNGFRYIRNGDGREELYDFARDPWERTDLGSLPAHRADLEAAREAVNRLLRGGPP